MRPNGRPSTPTITASTVVRPLCAKCMHDHWCRCGDEYLGICCQCDKQNAYDNGFHDFVASRGT